ncbi:uncharacterized protein LOC134542846 isoform X2 [Bacillus rossius redtenbacheri]|uniref:uncharacterized protein LOC134542846 isoform X2 n=1 Tax=Bacillus rossius redtenbacheri TaxID=93214 RepID=UPI002FDCEC4B
MHHRDDPNCPFREVVLEAVRELEETKQKFSEITEKVKDFEIKLKNTLNIIQKCGTLTCGASSQVLSSVENRRVDVSVTKNSSHHPVHTSGQKGCVSPTGLEEISIHIKTEPLETLQPGDVTGTPASSSARKHGLLLDGGTADTFPPEEPSQKRCKTDSCPAVQGGKDTENVEQKANQPGCTHENKIVAGSVVPVVDKGFQDDLSNKKKNGLANAELAKDSFNQLLDVICPRTLDAVKFFGFKKLTEVQAQVMQPMLLGRNMIVSFRRGAGKTLAYLIPAIEIIYRANFEPCDGVGCVIICPTNELVMQTYGVVLGLMQYHKLTYGMLLETKFKNSMISESEMLSQGVNILVSTPVKLLQCITAKKAEFSKLRCVVIDDSDFVLSKFRKDTKKILRLLPSSKQVVLFTANEISSSLKVEQLLPGTSFIAVRSRGTGLLPKGLEHYFVHCEAVKRTFLVFKLLQNWHQFEKVVVVFRRLYHVTYFGRWLPRLGIPVYAMNDYVCNAGLTARGINGKGKSLILLYPSQKDLLCMLQENGIVPRKYVFKDAENGMKVFHKKLQELVCSNKIMKNAARKVMYASLSIMKHSSHLLPQQSLELAEAFGLESLPELGDNKSSTARQKKRLKPRKKPCKNKKSRKGTSKRTLKQFKGTAQHLVDEVKLSVI